MNKNFCKRGRKKRKPIKLVKNPGKIRNKAPIILHRNTKIFLSSILGICRFLFKFKKLVILYNFKSSIPTPEVNIIESIDEIIPKIDDILKNKYNSKNGSDRKDNKSSLYIYSLLIEN